MATELNTERGIVRVPTGTWTLDPAHSSIEFRVKHMMVSTVRGRFGEFAGTIEAAPDYHQSKVRGTVKAASIDTNEPRRDEHLRSADFFDVDQHPEITFESTRIEHLKKGDYRVEGELTMHGETHTVEFEVTVHGVTKDPQGQDRVGLEARGTLSRGEFGLRWQQALETGGVLVGDEVRVSADIAAICTSPHAESAAAWAPASPARSRPGCRPRAARARRRLRGVSEDRQRSAACACARAAARSAAATPRQPPREPTRRRGRTSTPAYRRVLLRAGGGSLRRFIADGDIARDLCDGADR